MDKIALDLIDIIRNIRRSRDIEANLEALHELIRTRDKDIIAELSVRWLVSICDTFADYGTEIERRNALLVSMFINMLRIAEAVGAISGPFQPTRVGEVRSTRIEFFDGVMMFDIDRQDTYLNLCKRMARLMKDTPFLLAVWNEVLVRIHKEDNSISRLRGISAMPERYFPLDSLKMPDNYGVI